MRPTLENIVLRLRQEREDEASSDDGEDSDNTSGSSDGEPVEEPHLYLQSSDGELVEEASSIDTSSSDSDDDSNENSNGDDLTSPSGVTWKPNAPPPRRLSRNVINFHDGPTIAPASEEQSFSCFITEEMLRTSLRYTNRRLKALGKKKFTFNELKAGIAVIIRAGVDRDNMSSLSSLYVPSDSRPFYRCTISKNRLKILLAHLTFDNKINRRERQEIDKLAAIREFWDLFVLNLRRYYIPSSSITVDEQLYAYRGYSPGRTYMPQKPAKYGIKVFWLCDAENGYALNALPYYGADGARATGLAKTIVMQLTEPHHQSHRNVYFDRYFTSYELCVDLLNSGLTMTGTIQASRRDVPHAMKNAKDIPVHETRNFWNHDHRVLLTSYVPKKNKNVLLMSSYHTTNRPSEREDRKPEVILDYNTGKGGVDVMDSRVEDFTCRRKTRRYPLLHFFDMLDVALLNSFLIMEKNGYDKPRSFFIKQVALQLANDNIMTRYNTAAIYRQSKAAFSSMGYPARIPSTTTNDNKPKKCQVPRCGKSTRKRCANCALVVCSQHHIEKILCTSCASSP